MISVTCDKLIKKLAQRFRELRNACDRMRTDDMSTTDVHHTISFCLVSWNSEWLVWFNDAGSLLTVDCQS